MQTAPSESLSNPEDNEMVYPLILNSFTGRVGTDITREIYSESSVTFARSMRCRFYVNEVADGATIMEITETGRRITGYVLHDDGHGKFLLHTKAHHEQLRLETSLDPHMQAGVIVAGVIDDCRRVVKWVLPTNLTET